MKQREQALIAISVGNSRTQVGVIEGGEINRVERFPNGEIEPIIASIANTWQSLADADRRAVLLASVNDPIAVRLIAAIEDQLSTEVYRVGVDMPVPIGQQLDPETMTGVDRLLNAAAAYDRVKQACVVVDAGTAVTVDFIDGEGTFHGGAIAPGAGMQLRSLHNETAALPEIAFREPDHEAFGRNTAQAMLQGVFHGIRGMVQRLVEQYAEHYGAFPLIIATGGDANLLFENDQLVDRIVPDLTLMGIAVTAKYALSQGDSEEKLKERN
jgi:type III pantothenate kinase